MRVLIALSEPIINTQTLGPGMSDDVGRLLRPEDEREIQSFLEDTHGRFYGMLECIGRIVADGISEGRFTERQAHHDLEIALWVGYACNNISDYEHYCTSCEWLSRVEDLASGCGAWYYRYANALMYTGKPRLAMEYLSRGVEEEPGYPWCWLSLGRLRAHFGDRDGAVAAANKGLEIIPGDREFTQLLREIDEGYDLEHMEFHYIDEENDVEPGSDILAAFLDEGREESKLAEAVLGIVTDQEGLSEVKSALSPEGWIADHPYCTYMLSRDRGQVLVTLAMNEAFLSKVPADRLTSIIGRLDELEAGGRTELGERAEGRYLYGLTIDRRLRPMLSFAGYQDEEPAVVRFGQDLEPIRDSWQGGPFVAIVLLAEDGWDPEAIRRTLASVWGMRVREEAEDDSLVFEYEGNLGAFSMVHQPVPGEEAVEAAANNYMWPEARDAAAGHRAHLLVALVNHGCPAVDAAVIHTKMVDAACRLPGVLGVYLQNTVISPQAYMEEASGIMEGRLPVRDLVWIGLYRTERGINAYTRGMGLFCKEEMEIVGAEEPPDAIHSFLCDVINYVLENDVHLRDGDTVGYTEDMRLRIAESPGVSMEGTTLKIEKDRDGE